MGFFAVALTVYNILIFQIFDLENFGQYHVVEKRDLRHSIANINLY